MGTLFGTLCALSIGMSDLFARRVARASTALTTAIAISVVAIATSLVSVAAFGSTLEPSDFAIGLVSGIGLGFGLLTYYTGMTRSSSTVVSPVVATLSAVIPFAYAVARGDDATGAAIAGAGVAVAGLVLITVGGGRAHHVRAGLLWGLVSGLAYGCGFAVVIEASSGAGAFPAVGQRVAASVLVLALGARSGVALVPPRSVRWPALIGGGFAGMSTVLYLIGVRADATAAVITSSMFPAASVAIGRTFFGDTVTRVQALGIAVALVGIVGVVAG